MTTASCIFHLTHACSKLWFQFNLQILSAWLNGWCMLVPGWTTASRDMGCRCIKRATALRTDRLTPVDDPCIFFPCLFNAACAANTGWGGASAETELSASRNRKVVQPQKSIRSLLAAVLRTGAGDSLEGSQTTTYVSSICDHSGLWLYKSKNPNTLSMCRLDVPTILSKTHSDRISFRNIRTFILQSILQCIHAY